MRSRFLAATSMIAVAGFLATACAATEASKQGQDTAAVTTPAVGQCYHLTGHQSEADVWPKTATAIPCTEPHNVELRSITPIPDIAPRYVRDWGWWQCRKDAPPAAKPDRRAMPRSWPLGEDQMVCAGLSENQRGKSTLIAGPLASTVGWQPSCQTAIPDGNGVQRLITAPCDPGNPNSQALVGWAFYEGDWPAKYPGSDKMGRITDRKCQKAAGTSNVESLGLTKELWQRGARYGWCWAPA